MIDNFSLLATTAVIIFVVFQAVKLDKVLPWFESKPTEKFSDEPAKGAATASSRPSQGLGRVWKGRTAAANAQRPRV